VSPLSLFLLGFVPAFAIGAWARPYIDRLVAEGRRHMTHKELDDVPSGWRLNIIPWALGITALVACSALVYTVQVRQKAEDDNQYLTDCLSALLEESTAVSRARSEATEMRDAAKLKVIRATVRVATDPAPSYEEIQRANRALAEYEEASAELDEVRAGQPIPSFREYCASKVQRDGKGLEGGSLPQTPKPSKRPDGAPSPAGRVDDDSAMPSGTKQKADRKGRRAPSKDRDPSRPRSPRPPSPSPTSLVPDLELPDVQVPDLSGLLKVEGVTA
jgi:hypothetical protein